MNRQVIITVNYDSNELQIRTIEGKKEEVTSLECKNTMQTKTILNEVLNSIIWTDNSQEVVLEVVDEGEATTYDRW